MLLLASAIVVMTFRFAQTESIQRTPLPTSVLLTIWWVSPLIPYVFTCRTLLGAALIGAGYLLAVALFLNGIYTDEHSTAAIGRLAVPLLLWAGMGAALAIEGLATKRFFSSGP